VSERQYGRTLDRIRPINIYKDLFGYADASILFEIGETKVLVSISLQERVPPFLKGSKKGWLTAEYAMLPCATQNRIIREAVSNKRNARSVEISRLIGRSIRSAVNLDGLGERTIVIDCDVLQANGGTRVACITAASVALQIAVERWMQKGIIQKSIINEPVAAISAGIVDGRALLDLDQNEDSTAKADFNFILSRSGKLIEVQGTAEKEPLDWDEFDSLKDLARAGVTQLFEQIEASSGE
jgi:ribonuclease PH